MGAGTTVAAGAASRPGRGPVGEFTPQSADGVRESVAPTATMSIGALTSLDALLALQEAPDPAERRRRAIRRARGVLDALDQVKLALLEEGAGGRSALDRLQAVVRDLRDETDDPGLESVLDEVETRAAVELAKDEMAMRASGS
jgi:hypothetical protein